ncbi:MAG: hypothetical protein JWO60_2760, partial [Frankiales bacterium]|nr:hypothetical protein [Frankiales bacterium]
EAAAGARLLAAGLLVSARTPSTTVEVLDPAAPPAVAPEVTGAVEAGSP